MADSLKTRFAEKVELKVGATGQFDVKVDGKPIFSRSETGRLPIEDEVERRFAALKAGNEPPPLEPSRGFISRILSKLRS